MPLNVFSLMKPLIFLAYLLGGSLPALAEMPATDLPFSEFFRQPLGPRGLEPTARLMSLAGKRVRLTGYLVHAENAGPGMALLVPQPVLMGDGDEGLADDLPASTVTVLGDVPVNWPPFVSLRLSGTLEIAPRQEADGRISYIRLLLDKAAAKP